MAGTYLIVEHGSAGFQMGQNLLIHLSGYGGTLPALGTIPVASFLV